MSDFTGSGAVSVQSGAVVAQSGPDWNAYSMLTEFACPPTAQKSRRIVRSSGRIVMTDELSDGTFLVVLGRRNCIGSAVSGPYQGDDARFSAPLV